MLGDFFISVEELGHRLATAGPVRIFDVRRPAALGPESRFLPGSRWRSHLDVHNWVRGLCRDHPIVVNCMHGHNVSQIAAALLMDQGYTAKVLTGGVDGWIEAGLPTVGHSRLCPPDAPPGIWVTGIEPTIDSIAGQWLITRFIDPDAVFHFVQAEWVTDVADELGGISFGAPGTTVPPDGEHCSFDALLSAFAVNDPALEHLAVIVRAAGTGRLDLAPEAAGVLSVLQGQTLLDTSDQNGLRLAFPVYDALYARLNLADGTSRGRRPLSN